MLIGSRWGEEVMPPDWIGVAALLLIITTITAVGYLEGHSML